MYVRGFLGRSKAHSRIGAHRVSYSSGLDKSYSETLSGNSVYSDSGSVRGRSYSSLSKTVIINRMRSV